MKRRVWNKLKELANQVVHGGQHSACDLVEDTGTRIEVTKLGQNKFRIDLRLRGGDSESQM